MGTRADFYKGRGKDMQYLGSISWDGYPDGLLILADCKTEEYFDTLIKALQERDDFSNPATDGWPWPWTNSSMTDFAYTFDDGKVWVSHFGRNWIEFDLATKIQGPWPEYNRPQFPDMTAIQSVTLGKRSGLIVLTQEHREEQ